MDFDTTFEALTGNPPFPWQRALYERLIGNDVPASCSIPTGLGKTAVIPVWLIALAQQPGSIPRRLVYVVNRRTVVDQSTLEAEKIRTLLTDPMSDNALPHLVNARQQLATRLRALSVIESGEPVAISTLRGQFADNAEWRLDPARPAIIVGTVDMIGSRLLFSGYGVGFKSRPLHAGFLGQDTLVVHDEAHLEPAFQSLLESILKEQRHGRFPDCRTLERQFRVMALTATSRGSDAGRLELSEADRKNPVARKRLQAQKSLRLHPIADDKQIAERVAELALQHSDSGKAILVFVRRVEDVQKIRSLLEKAKHSQVQTLTGTLRGYERDRMADPRRPDGCPIFARFLRPPKLEEGAAAQWRIEPATGTVFLVSTSAGEVGVNISADHMICDLSPFDSMAQRLGRVNRFGDVESQVDVVYPESFGEGDRLATARERTLELLRQLPESDGEYDASPNGLRSIPMEDQQSGFSPQPTVLDVDDILFDAWSMTSIRDELPGRPPVADWLHGVNDDYEPPQTEVAWRDDVSLLDGTDLADEELSELLGDYPLKPQELLRDRSDRIAEGLLKRAAANPELAAWLVSPLGQVRRITLGALVDDKKQLAGQIANQTFVLSPKAGGLTSTGMFDGSAGYDPELVNDYDVADKELFNSHGRPIRMRSTGPIDRPPQMRLVCSVVLPDLAEEEGEAEADAETGGPRYRTFWVRVKSADDDGSRSAVEKQVLDNHCRRVSDLAALFGQKSGLDTDQVEALRLAGLWHDLGKNRGAWQRAIGNDRWPEEVWAKSVNPKARISLIYRHEFGSLLDLRRENNFQRLTPELQDLVLHLVAVHHG
ncbi:MAG TPA: type I-U CRISPR-associated helicase/endonuclease Cas3, partial [Planctomycetaceae bacterium]|nr:type I-U CRISPR-associated helicase/endonuclease Cas3 [Planctomycetaceae bacterium]